MSRGQKEANFGKGFPSPTDIKQTKPKKIQSSTLSIVGIWARFKRKRVPQKIF